jgi:hypothetical protein
MPVIAKTLGKAMTRGVRTARRGKGRGKKGKLGSEFERWLRNAGAAIGVSAGGSRIYQKIKEKKKRAKKP